MKSNAKVEDRRRWEKEKGERRKEGRKRRRDSNQGGREAL